MTPAIPAKSKTSKFVKAHIALSFVPWLNLACFWSYAFYVRWQFGRWPKAMTDDPIIPGGYVIDNLYGIVFSATLASIPLWLVVLFVRLTRQDTRQIYKPACIFLLAWAASYTLSFADTGHFSDWLID